MSRFAHEAPRINATRARKRSRQHLRREGGARANAPHLDPGARRDTMNGAQIHVDVCATQPMS